MIRFLPLAAETVARWRAGVPDDYGLPPERAISTGAGTPCRHCLRDVPAGAEYLIVAHRPFVGLNPYTETGPIFVCADCRPALAGQGLPAMLRSPDYIVRGYSADERIVYGTGAVVAVAAIAERAAELLAREDIAFVHVRSARNNCFQCRIERD